MSDYELRYSVALAAAEEVFESREHAQDWLNAPLYPFDRKRPVDLLDNEEGLRSVLAVILRIEYGGIA